MRRVALTATPWLTLFWCQHRCPKQRSLKSTATMKPTIEAHEKGLPTVRKKQKARTPKPKKTKKKKAKRSKEVNNAENS